jgi:hypothetical protein
MVHPAEDAAQLNSGMKVANTRVNVAIAKPNARSRSKAVD